MTMTLYGSLPSPYVRRIRMLMDGMDYRFEAVELYDDEKRAEYAAVSPIKKLPVLVDGDQTIFDSHVITEYLRRKQGQPDLPIEQHNLVAAVDGVNDSLIVLFMGARSELEVSDKKLIFKLQLGRIPDTLRWLNSEAEKGAFEEWSIATIALISMMDWAEFRALYEFSAYPALLAARKSHQGRAIVQSTYPE